MLVSSFGWVKLLDVQRAGPRVFAFQVPRLERGVGTIPKTRMKHIRVV